MRLAVIADIHGNSAALDAVLADERPDTLVVEYRGLRERVRGYAERSLTAALERLARRGERWIVFLAGHAENDPHGEANFDLGLFGKELERGGFRLQQIKLAETVIPTNTSLLVIASPRVNLLPGEVRSVVRCGDLRDRIERLVRRDLHADRTRAGDPAPGRRARLDPGGMDPRIGSRRIVVGMGRLEARGASRGDLHGHLVRDDRLEFAAGGVGATRCGRDRHTHRILLRDSGHH